MAPVTSGVLEASDLCVGGASDMCLTGRWSCHRVLRKWLGYVTVVTKVNYGNQSNCSKKVAVTQ